MTVRIDESEASISASELEAIEKKLGIHLPDQYRSFLLVHNGGRPTPSIFRYRNEAGPYTDSEVDWFLAIQSKDYNDFETYYDRYKIHRIRMPTELVPIADDPGGNVICIVVDGPKLGAVYFWDHEEEQDLPSYKNVHLIANSFDEFMNLLSEN
jgi:cell wall assembly regulator SMI1